MAYANLYVTDGDLHVQAVDTLPTPNPRGVFDSQRTNMVGNARAVPCVDEIVATAPCRLRQVGTGAGATVQHRSAADSPCMTQTIGLTSRVTCSIGCHCSYFGPPKHKNKPKRLPSIAGRPGSAPATAPAGTDASAEAATHDAPSEEKERVEKMLGALCAPRRRVSCLWV